MKVSIVIPTWNGEHEIGECLRGVFSQIVDFEFDVLVIDSSSTDRTPEIARSFPVRFVRIAQRDFDHGDTRNLGAMLTDGDFIVFLVQDAYPERRDWLSTLVSNFRDPSVGAAFCRIVPRPTAGLLVRKGVQGDLCFASERIEAVIDDPKAYLALDPLARRIFINFNDVASCLRRSAWRRLPFPRVQFGEDLLWAKAALEAGYRIVFDPAATVVHSHEYDPKTLRKRTRIDAWLNRAYLDRECIRRGRDALIMTWRVARADRRFLREQGLARFKRMKLGALSLWYHFLEFWGFWEGTRTRDRIVCPRATDKDRLKILFVVHAFPPESLAGTEVLTLSLAKALQRRGHEVVVFHRVSGADQENYALSEGEHDGLRVIRIANHLRFANIEETYRNAHVEARFREVLERERPDVVHFEHLIHLSATLPRICREAGIGSVLTLNDFWFRCPRVQLIRPDETVCAGKPPILGCAACVANLPRWIDAAAIVSRPIRGLLHRLGARYLRLVRKAPRWFTKHASDVACIATRPATMLAELSQADFVIAPMPFLAGKMIEAGVPRAKLVVSDYGMETRWLEGYVRRAKSDKVRFGFIGSLVWYKGLEVLAKAFQQLESDRAELHVHGDTESLPEFRTTRARIEEHVKRAGLHFHGRYSPADLGRVLGAIDVLVVPSVWYENSPLAIHEAFQAGVPVLVSDRGGMRDLVAEGKGGMRFRAGDAADLARVMRRFLAEPGLAESVARAAPPVKTVDENAAEMEIKYRQAMGIHSAHRDLLHLPAARFGRKHGAVESQSDSLVLLRPEGEANGRADAGRGSWVSYEVRTDRALTAELRFEQRHFAGEAGVVQGGLVELNGRAVLEIPPASTGGVDRVVLHAARVDVPKGRSTLRVRNRIRGVGGGTYFLRFAELSLLRLGTKS